MAERLKRTEEKLQVTVSRLDEETSVRLETCKINDILENQYELLRRNFKRTLRMLNASEQTVRDTRLELDEVVAVYQELQDKCVDEGRWAGCGELPECTLRTDNERLSEDNVRFVLHRTPIWPFALLTSSSVRVTGWRVL